jgi:hypothetical protein
MHVGPAFGEPGDTALPLARNGVAFRRLHVGERDLPVKGRLHRADLGRHARGEPFRRTPFQGFAAGNAFAQYVRVVQHRPDPLARRRDPILALQLHEFASEPDSAHGHICRQQNFQGAASSRAKRRWHGGC